MHSLGVEVPASAEDVGACDLLAGVDVVYPDNSQLQNHMVSECGRFESFDYNGYHFEVDWDEIDPPGIDDEPGIPHEQVMREMRELEEQLEAEQ